MQYTWHCMHNACCCMHSHPEVHVWWNANAELVRWPGGCHTQTPSVTLLYHTTISAYPITTNKQKFNITALNSNKEHLCVVSDCTAMSRAARGWWRDSRFPVKCMKHDNNDISVSTCSYRHSFSAKMSLRRCYKEIHLDRWRNFQNQISFVSVGVIGLKQDVSSWQDRLTNECVHTRTAATLGVESHKKATWSIRHWVRIHPRGIARSMKCSISTPKRICVIIVSYLWWEH